MSRDQTSCIENNPLIHEQQDHYAYQLNRHFSHQQTYWHTHIIRHDTLVYNGSVYFFLINQWSQDRPRIKTNCLTLKRESFLENRQFFFINIYKHWYIFIFFYPKLGTGSLPQDETSTLKNSPRLKSLPKLEVSTRADKAGATGRVLFLLPCGLSRLDVLSVDLKVFW